MKKIVLGLGGSSGSIYARLLLERIQKLDDQVAECAVVASKNAITNWNIEQGDVDIRSYGFKLYEKDNFFAPFASGSANFETMIICPCSMGLLGRIANGISDDLMTRSADVILKERRRLIVVPRETPYNLIHLKNMVALTEAGGIICPATPSFYSNPQTLDEVAATVTDRVLDLAGLDISTYRWGESPD